jgi:glucose-6-phosphate isomerase
MHVDIGNTLAEVAHPGVSQDALDRLDERVAHAHSRIEDGIAGNEFGYAALSLPETVDADSIYEATDSFTNANHVLTVGIGGSALGALTLSRALGLAGHVAVDNVDPAHTRQVLETLPLNETVVHVVSKSGTTAETLANFLIVQEAMSAAGVDWTEQTIVTTGETGPLRAAADTEGLPVFDVPAGVPGRFTALSSVGLVPAAILGGDIEAVLAGGHTARNSLSPSLFDCPAYAYAAVCYALETRGASMNVMMPYAESLEPFAEWFAQLWAESLGKDGLGQTPVCALGVTDQHSQLQLYRAGRHDKLITFVTPAERRSVPIPETDIDGLAYLGDGQTTLGDLIDAEFAATEASLAVAGQPNVRVTVSEGPEGIGDLLVAMEAACILVGELHGIETFTQPAVEWGKRAARGLLGGGEFEEADLVEQKHRLVIE